MKKQQPALSKSAMLLRDTYDLYSKMLAVEKISVVFDEAISAPAQFDILNRILYIAPVHSVQAELIPGLVIHEVGHALFSTLTEDEAKKLKKITKILNIIDDGYQERMMCKKYANSKKHLLTVFDHFFLADKSDAPYKGANKLINIVNTLNFNCKGFKHGHYKQYGSYVLPEDLALLQEAELISLPSLIERDEFAKKLSKALKKYGEMADDDQDLGSKIGSDKSDKGDGEGESADCEGGDSPTLHDDDDEKEDGDCQDASGDGEGGQGDSSGDPVEDELENNESKLNDHHKKFKQHMGKGPTYELPTGKDLLDFATVRDIYQKNGPIEKALLDVKNLTLGDKYKRVLKEVKKTASRIFTKFNMKVQAQNYANTQFKRSGALDPERAALYQVYDDVFMKNSIDPNQQNHAYTIMLDWSSSMSGSIYILTLRVMELVYFAKAAGIEIEVWLYTTGVGKKINSHKNLALIDSRFIKILNSKQHGAQELDARVKHLWVVAHQLNYSCSPKLIGQEAVNLIGNDFGMSGTNILEGLILGHHQLAKMEADVKTCFILSDGQDSGGFDIWHSPARTIRHYDQAGKIYVNGMDVDFLYKGRHTRGSATEAIGTLFASSGQRTTGVAWNTSPAHMETYTQNIVCGNTAISHGSMDDYVQTDNIFIDAIVKELL